MNFIVSAPGKIILTGEHSVVYGYKAIASSINLRCQAKITTKTIDNLIHLRLNIVQFDFSITENEFIDLKSKLGNRKQSSISPDYLSILIDFLNDKTSIAKVDEDFIKPAVAVFFDIYLQTIADRFLPIDISINCEFPHSCGLGSSAAYSTVLSTALLVLCGRIPPDGAALTDAHLDSISELAFRGERILHGSPSGIDNNISTFGRGIVFQRLSGGVVKRPIQVPNLRILLVDTRVKRSTKTVVEYVKDRLQMDPVKYDNWFREIHELTESLETLLGDRDDGGGDTILAGVNRVIEENQRVLQLVGVSHPTIEEVVGILRCYGVSGKLTGAGWGGCVFGVINDLSEERLDKMIEHLRERGYGTSVTSLSCGGVDLTI